MRIGELNEVYPSHCLRDYKERIIARCAAPYTGNKLTSKLYFGMVTFSLRQLPGGVDPCFDLLDRIGFFP